MPLRGEYHTEEAKAKMRARWTERRKLPNLLKGRHLRQETRAKLRAALKGQHRSVRTEFRKGLRASPVTEFKAGHAPWSKGKTLGPLTPEHRATLSKALKGVNKGRKRPDLTAHRFIGSGPLNPFYGKKHSLEVRKLISDKLKESSAFHRLNDDSQFQQKRLKGLHKRPSTPERALEHLLEMLFPHQWLYTGDGSLIVGKKCPDFANISGPKKLIEVFGDYWHRGENPEKRINYFGKFGFHTLIVWESEIKDTNKLAETLRRFQECGC